MDTNTQQEMPYDTKGAAKIFSRIGFALIAFLLAANLVAAGLQLLFLVLFPGMTFTATAAVLVSAISMYGIALPIFYICLGKTESLAPPRGKAQVSTLCILTVICFAFMYFGNILGITASSFFESLFGFALTETTLEIVMQVPWYIALLFLSLLGPLVEEFIFRRLIIDRTRVYGEKLSILFSALLFGFFHMSIQQFFYAFFIGLALGYLYMRTGKLRAVWAVHAAINFLGSVVPLLLMQYCGYNDLLEAMTNGPEAMLAEVAANPIGITAVLLYGFFDMALVILGCVLFFLFSKRLRFERAERTLPRDTEGVVAFANIGVVLFIAMCTILPVVLTVIG